MAAAAAENDEDAFLSCLGVGRFIDPDVVAVSCGPSCLQFTFWLLAGLWADGAMEGSACLVPIPFFILWGLICLCGAVHAGVLTSMVIAENNQSYEHRGCHKAVVYVPIAFALIFAGLRVWALPAVQACTAIDAGWDASEAGFPGQSNWYVVSTGWLLLTAAFVLLASRSLCKRLRASKTPFTPEGHLPACQLCLCCLRGKIRIPFDEHIVAAEWPLQHRAAVAAAPAHLRGLVPGAGRAAQV